jgi:membrane-bound ClpP family serine protease
MEEDKKAHFFDLKLPLGGLLGFYGLVLLIYSFFTKADSYQKSLGININFYWGILLLLFGAVMIFLSFRKPRR